MVKESKEFYIDSDGISLHCKLDFPEKESNTGKYPLVILQHGLTGHMEEHHIVAAGETFRRNGCAVLRTELYGHGKSGGNYKDHNVWKWVLELVDVIDYARKLDFVSELILSGHSQGGLTVMLAAGIKSDCIRALIPLAPALVIRDAARSGNLFGITFDPVNVPDEIGIKVKSLSGNYFRINRYLPVEECVAIYKGPVLIIHSDTDEAAPYRYSKDIVEKYADAELVTIRNDTHCFDNHLDEMENAISTFIKRIYPDL